MLQGEQTQLIAAFYGFNNDRLKITIATKDTAIDSYMFYYYQHNTLCISKVDYNSICNVASCEISFSFVSHFLQ